MKHKPHLKIVLMRLISGSGARTMAVYFVIQYARRLIKKANISMWKKRKEKKLFVRRNLNNGRCKIYLRYYCAIYDGDKLLSFVLFSLTEAMFSMPDFDDQPRNNISHLHNISVTAVFFLLIRIIPNIRKIHICVCYTHIWVNIYNHIWTINMEQIFRISNNKI